MVLFYYFFAPRYVQHILSKNAKLVWSLLNSGACIYVAGNSKDMPASVREAIRDTISSVGGLSTDSANSMLDKMDKEGRYQTETWG